MQHVHEEVKAFLEARHETFQTSSALRSGVSSHALLHRHPFSLSTIDPLIELRASAEPLLWRLGAREDGATILSATLAEEKPKKRRREDSLHNGKSTTSLAALVGPFGEEVLAAVATTPTATNGRVSLEAQLVVGAAVDVRQLRDVLQRASAWQEAVVCHQRHEGDASGRRPRALLLTRLDAEKAHLLLANLQAADDEKRRTAAKDDASTESSGGKGSEAAKRLRSFSKCMPAFGQDLSWLGGFGSWSRPSKHDTK